VPLLDGQDEPLARNRVGRRRVRQSEAEDVVPILMYHSIDKHAAPAFSRFTMDPRSFAEQLCWLAEYGYKTMTVAELAKWRRSERPVPEKTVVLTFDDGFADFYREALPLLQQHCYTATLYVITGFVGGTSRWLGSCGEADKPMLTWPILREISALGIEIGGHTHTHPELDRLPPQRVEKELVQSRIALEDGLGAAVKSFAYPFGYWSGPVRAAVADAGFEVAVQVGELACSSSDDVLSLPRITMNSGTSASAVANTVASRPNSASWFMSASKRLLWQTLRRHVPGVIAEPDEGARALGEPRLDGA
jgi:peptidoglycan/xylan/chitin deacetylase (PgdA/CDA1 family)